MKFYYKNGQICHPEGYRNVWQKGMKRERLGMIKWEKEFGLERQTTGQIANSNSGLFHAIFMLKGLWC